MKDDVLCLASGALTVVGLCLLVVGLLVCPHAVYAVEGAMSYAPCAVECFEGCPSWLNSMCSGNPPTSAGCLADPNFCTHCLCKPTMSGRCYCF